MLVSVSLPSYCTFYSQRWVTSQNMSSQKVVLSEAHTNRMNQGKKRAYHPEGHKDFMAKKNKDAGNPYKGRKGFHPGIQPPDQGKTCGSCIRLGCLLSYNHKLDLFQQFRSKSYNEQTGILVKCIEMTIPTTRRSDPTTSRKRFTYDYSVSVNGIKYPVCRQTLMDIFGISNDRIKVLVKKLESGEASPTDRRGTHTNRKRVPEEIKESIRDHVLSFPSYESHYGRSSGDPTRKYLSPDLSVSKMYSLFIQHQRDINEAECEEWVYSHIFNTEFTNLRIMTLKSDTCDLCDKIAARIKDATADEMAKLEMERDFHHTLGARAYETYAEDKQRANQDVSYIVLTVDLQQVLFTPGLQNSASFYLRKLSNYNLCITNANDGSSSMMLWNEVQGNRGSNEVASLIFKYITERYTRSGPPQKLIIWFDRCVGQNNNTIILSMLMKLVRQGYFKEIQQNFFVTGHSFNDCDRKFGMIEKKKRQCTLLIPSDIVNLVSESSLSSPFTPVQIQQSDILDFKTHSKFIRHHSTFRVTQHLSYRYSMDSPNILLAKSSHDLLEPEMGYPMRISLEFNQVPNRAYSSPLKLDSKKLADLRKLADFLDSEPFAYYTSLIAEQMEIDNVTDELDEP